MLTRQALYDVIRGQTLSLKRGKGTVSLCPEDDELIIDCLHASEHRQYRVWLAEVALGWNMLRGPASTGIHLA